MPQKTADQDFGLLQAIDERLAMYGWLTNTGIKFVIIVDMEGRPATANDPRTIAPVGLRDSDLKPVCLSVELYSVRTKHLLTRGRRSKRYTRRTSTYSRIRSTNPITSHCLLQSMVILRRSRAKSSSKKSNE
jgi:hypothetical protein